MRLPVAIVFLGLAVWVLGSSAGTRFRYEITDLGTLGGATGIAQGINQAGLVVGGTDGPDGTRRAFLWQDGTMTDLGTIVAGAAHEAADVNNNDEVVGYATAGGGVGDMFYWADGQITELGNPSHNRWAFAINDFGQIVGQATFPESGTHAFLYQDEAMIDLGTLGGSHSLARDINNAGQIAGRSFLGGGGERAFLWEDGVMTNLGNLGIGASEAVAVNDAGQVTGDSHRDPGSPAIYPFLWENGQMTDFMSEPKYVFGQSWGMNNEGQVVISGEVELADGPAKRAWMHDPLYGLIDLLDTLPAGHGWSELVPRDINDAGQIVGVGTSPIGYRRPFLMDPLPPIPAASAWTLAAAALALTTAGTILLRRNRLPARPRAVE